MLKGKERKICLLVENIFFYNRVYHNVSSTSFIKNCMILLTPQFTSVQTRHKNMIINNKLCQRPLFMAIQVGYLRKFAKQV